MAEIYDTTQQNISQHVINIYNDKELEDEATHKKFLLVRKEGSRNVKREIDHYNLDIATTNWKTTAASCKFFSAGVIGDSKKGTLLWCMRS